MAAGVAPSYQQFSFSSPFSASPNVVSPMGSSSSRKLPTFTSVRSLGNAQDRRGSSTDAKSSRQHALRSTLRGIDTNKMSSSMTTTTTPSASPLKRSDSFQPKLHKRASSSSSLNKSPAVPNTPYSHFTTPYATYEEEPFPEVTTHTTPTTSTPKIKPYLRKISSPGKEVGDQGRLDLSKSVSEISTIAGLGITDFAAPTRADTLSNGRTTPLHARTTSVGSTLSSGSGYSRPTQPFVHPMRQTPNRPYTPATDASSMHDDDEAFESTDTIAAEDISRPPMPGRSASISTPQATTTVPTPLPRAHTLADLNQVPKLTSKSQSNLSTHSSRSLKSSLRRPRGDTNRSFEYITSPSSRTSLEKTFSFVSRRSSPDDAIPTPQTRDEIIAAARRKFDEKEANKTYKAEQEDLKRRQSEHAKTVKKQERARRQSTASTTNTDRPKIPKMLSQRSLRNRGEGLKTLRYDQSTVTAMPPRHGSEPGKSEKIERGFGTVEVLRVGKDERKNGRGATGSGSAGWKALSTWLQTRLLSCGKKAG